MATAGLTYKVDGSNVEEIRGFIDGALEIVGIHPKNIGRYLVEITPSISKKSVRDIVDLTKTKIKEELESKFEESDLSPEKKKLSFEITEKYIKGLELVFSKYKFDMKGIIRQINYVEKIESLEKKEEEQKIDDVEKFGESIEKFLETLYSNLTIGVGSGAVTYECIKDLPLSENHKALLSILASTAAITLLVPGLSTLVKRYVRRYKNEKNKYIRKIEEKYEKKLEKYENKLTKAFGSEAEKIYEETLKSVEQDMQKHVAEASTEEKDGEPITL